MLMFWTHKQTQAQRDAALADLAIKLSLEETVKRELRPIFNRIARDLRVQYAAEGRVPDAQTYVADFEAALRNHYARVQSQFQGRVDDNPEFAEALAVLALSYRNRRAPQQAAIISETNGRQLSAAVDVAREDGETDRRTIAALSAVVFRRMFNPRIETIGLTETQNAAEDTKSTEATHSANMTGRTATKKWVDVGDRRVRQSHRTAGNSAAIAITSVFTVGNSLLAYPGDTSRGADIEEWINCRCSAQYDFF